ncbi:hypothetical protein F4801DRAFT_568583 [Xylaria longipes]|nr:hypothetical protein F4801DRAFT_568583 [Xylaria longipes]
MRRSTIELASGVAKEIAGMTVGHITIALLLGSYPIVSALDVEQICLETMWEVTIVWLRGSDITYVYKCQPDSPEVVALRHDPCT